MLVALAVTELSPSQMSAGKDTRVPPPAIELMAPARNAAAKATAACQKSNPECNYEDIALRTFALHRIASSFNSGRSASEQWNAHAAMAAQTLTDFHLPRRNITTATNASTASAEQMARYTPRGPYPACCDSHQAVGIWSIQ